MISLIENIFSDVFQIYKNFFHWNISKLIFSVYGLLVGILLAIVPLVLFGVFLSASHVDIGILSNFWLNNTGGVEFSGAFLASPVTSILALIMLVLVAVSIFVGIWYGRLFISRLSFKYIARKKKTYFKKKAFLNRGAIWSFVKITLWIFLGMFVAALLYFIGLVILTLLFGGVSSTTQDLLANEIGAFSIATLIYTLISGLVYLYYGFRISFSYLCFIDAGKKVAPALSYIKTSYKLTAGWKKLLRFMAVFVITAIVLAPVNLLGEHIATVKNDIIAYLELYQAKTQLGEDELVRQLTVDNPRGANYYRDLSGSYSQVSPEQLISQVHSYDTYNWIFNVFYFFLIYGVFHMVFASFYIRELKTK